jgi:hypothetical protein
MRETPEGITTEAVVVDLTQGNPGALTVIMGILKAGREDVIDFLYRYEEIKGPALWMLYKDENGEDIDQTIGAIELLEMTS